ncbi:hypothetical protein XENTR_v10005764 [Xenopus tropicalis]|nr:hypothetical protein XENTR_v10005764 [Xenopus tropicalis]
MNWMLKGTAQSVVQRHNIMYRFLIFSAILLFAVAIDSSKKQNSTLEINPDPEPSPSSNPGSFTSPVSLFICTLLSFFYHMLAN